MPYENLLKLNYIKITKRCFKITIYKNYIAGKWIESNSKETFKSINPADPNKSLGTFQSSTKEDAKQAIESAQKVQQEWEDTPPPSRGKILQTIAELLKKQKESLAKEMTQEMGKVLNETKGDVQEAIDVFEYMAAEGRRLFGRTTTSELRDKFCMTIRKPIGVVSMITPWNFPMAIPAWKIAPALICGNSFVIKPSSDTPLLAIRLMQILEKAGVPKGVANLVTGSGDTVGKELIQNKKSALISFTGSRDTGEFVTKNAGVKKIGLELGGKNAIIILDDADLNLALEGVLWGAFGTTGQRCTATSRVIITKSIKNKFEKLLLNRTKKLKLGSGLKKDTDIGPLINKKALEKTHNYTQIGLKEGAKLLCGGEIPKMNGFFYKPTIFTNVTTDMRIAKEEIFGPSLSIIEVSNLNEAIKAHNSVDYGLSSSVYTNNIRNAMNAIQKLQAGITYINSSTIGAEVHLPFGGVKQTGNGTKEAGWTGIDEFSEEKAIYIDYSGKLQKAQIDTNRGD